MSRNLNKRQLAYNAAVDAMLEAQAHLEDALDDFNRAQDARQALYHIPSIHRRLELREVPRDTRN